MAEPLRVLVIEDDEEIRFIVGEMLADEGWDVREAADRFQALDLLATWQPDVILLDLMLPAMDARAFHAEQRARGVALEVRLSSCLPAAMLPRWRSNWGPSRRSSSRLTLTTW